MPWKGNSPILGLLLVYDIIRYVEASGLHLCHAGLALQIVRSHSGDVYLLTSVD